MADYQPATTIKADMSASSKCVKCGGEMQEGFIPDEGYGKRFVLRWVAGKPVENIIGSAKVWFKEKHLIQSFRCVNCGYLELYATGE